MGDVAERSAVHQRRPALERLHQVREDGVLEQQRHGAGGLEVARPDRLPVAGHAHDDAGAAGLEIGQVLRQAEDRHDLAAGDDHPALLARRAAVEAAQPDHRRAERPIVHVDGARPGHPAGVDAEGVAVVDVVVEHRGQEIVRRRDGVEVAGEMQVDLVHRDDLRVAAAGRAALDAEHRAQRGLADADHDLLAEAAERLADPDVTVLLPSPAGVGLMPVTSTSRPFGLRAATASGVILALYRP